MNPHSADPYKALGVEVDADASAIKTAYRKLVLRCHPDKVQDPTLKAAKQDEFQRVQQAYEILSDETKRREYDDDAKLRKLREKFVRSMTTPTPSSPKEYNVRTADPPPSFKATTPFTTYTPGGSPKFAHGWDQGIPHRTKKMYEEEARARHAAAAAAAASSYEKVREEPKDERRRRKAAEYDVPPPHEWVREKERGKKTRAADREKDDKRDRQKRELEKRDKERDRTRRQEQLDKARMRKPSPYVEIYDNDYEDDISQHKKKPTAASNGAATPSSSTPAGAGTAAGTAAAGTSRSKMAEANGGKTTDDLEAAANYMSWMKKTRDGKSASSTPTSDDLPQNPNFPDPEKWKGAAESARHQRRSSPGVKAFHVTVEPEDPDVEAFMSPAAGSRKPRLSKSHTSPIGLGRVHTSAPSSSPLPRYPSLSRAATMDHARFATASASSPSAAMPFVEASRHSLKTDRHRRGSADTYEDLRTHRMPSHSRSTSNRYHDFDYDMPRTKSSRYYDAGGFGYYSNPLGDSDGRTYGGSKVSRTYSRDQIKQSKQYSQEDIKYGTLPHSGQYSSPYAYAS